MEDAHVSDTVYNWRDNRRGMRRANSILSVFIGGWTMTDRQKKGLGFLISGAVFLGVGGIFIGLPASPAWLDIVITSIGAVAQVVGLVVTLPEA